MSLDNLVGHPNRPVSLNGLSHHLSIRTFSLGNAGPRWIHSPQSRSTWPSPTRPGRRLRVGSLNNLAGDLSYLYMQLGAIEDLHEAIILARDLMALCPLGHPDRSKSLENFARHLRNWFAWYKQPLYAQLDHWSHKLGGAIRAGIYAS